MQTTMKTEDFTRVNNDSNGNPRYVCHFLNLITDNERGYSYSEGVKVEDMKLTIDQKYSAALKRARQLGGKKYHNKSYGGGIVFQSYNIKDLTEKINELVNQSK